MKISSFSKRPLAIGSLDQCLEQLDKEVEDRLGVKIIIHSVTDTIQKENGWDTFIRAVVYSQPK